MLSTTTQINKTECRIASGKCERRWRWQRARQTSYLLWRKNRLARVTHLFLVLLPVSYCLYNTKYDIKLKALQNSSVLFKVDNVSLSSASEYLNFKLLATSIKEIITNTNILWMTNIKDGDDEIWWSFNQWSINENFFDTHNKLVVEKCLLSSLWANKTNQLLPASQASFYQFVVFNSRQTKVHKKQISHYFVFYGRQNINI